MQANVGNADRIIRIVLGIALLALLAFGEGGVRWVGLIGIVPLATAFIRWCPAYAIFGMNTCGTKSA